LPLAERKALLKKLIAKTANQFSESFAVDGPEMFKHACGIGLEGVVYKVRDSRYSSGRGNDWLKKTCGAAGDACRSPALPSRKTSSTGSTWAAERART
jgi:ATP-dependent DNA ligase